MPLAKDVSEPWRENRTHDSTGGSWKRACGCHGRRRRAPVRNRGDERRAYSRPQLPRQFPTLPQTGSLTVRNRTELAA